MNKNIRLLDCTLRDGGHINEGKFGEEVIVGITEKLVNVGIDIVELGFMWDTPQEKDTSRFYTMNDVKKILPTRRGRSKFSVMIEKQNLLGHIEECDGAIEYIRVIFKRHLQDWAFDTVRELKAKGYKVFMNAVNCTVYTDEEYLELINRVNKIKPYAMSMVDTFGTMRMESLEQRIKLIDNNLDDDICLGVHLHENLGLAYAMAQRAIEIAKPSRNMIIDGSIMGMGRDPGNLKIEQITEYLNYKMDKKYNIDPIYDAIDDYIKPLFHYYNWGFKIPYAMGAYYDLHRTYPEFLMKKGNLSTKDINLILSKVERSEAEYFNENYIEQLYQMYVNKIAEGNAI